jgi:hypothetical protein
MSNDPLSLQFHHIQYHIEELLRGQVPGDLPTTYRPPLGTHNMNSNTNVLHGKTQPLYHTHAISLDRIGKGKQKGIKPVDRHQIWVATDVGSACTATAKFAFFAFFARTICTF